MDEKLKLFGRRLKLRRLELGFTQSYMAQKIGVSQNVYSLNERNINVMPLDRLFKIAEILNLKISFEVIE